MSESFEEKVRIMRDEMLADEFTGIRTFQGFEKELSEKIEHTSKEEISDILEGKSVLYIKSAGAGCYYKVFKALGFEKILKYCVSSSAGDWTFIGKHKDPNIGWRVCFQENAFPDYGFRYGCSDYGSPDINEFVDLVWINTILSDDEAEALLKYIYESMENES